MPTMGAHLALLPKNFKGKDYQATDCDHLRLRRRRGHHQGRRQDAGVGSEGRVRRAVLDEALPQAKKESVLFSISDRPAQEALGIWREKA